MIRREFLKICGAITVAGISLPKGFEAVKTDDSLSPDELFDAQACLHSGDWEAYVTEKGYISNVPCQWQTSDKRNFEVFAVLGHGIFVPRGGEKRFIRAWRVMPSQDVVQL